MCAVEVQEGSLIQQIGLLIGIGCVGDHFQHSLCFRHDLAKPPGRFCECSLVGVWGDRTQRRVHRVCPGLDGATMYCVIVRRSCTCAPTTLRTFVLCASVCCKITGTAGGRSMLCLEEFQAVARKVPDAHQSGPLRPHTVHLPLAYPSNLAICTYPL